MRFRSPSNSGHGIGQLQKLGTKQYELGETGLQLAIVLPSIALIARSTWIAATVLLFAFSGIALAVATHFEVATFQ